VQKQKLETQKKELHFSPNLAETASLSDHHFVVVAHLASELPSDANISGFSGSMTPPTAFSLS
jgi:hypothetical protein